MPRGRPVKSEIRQNIVEILYFIKEGYGYEIYNAYREIFPKVTMRSIYYHLKKGIQTGEIQVEQVKTEKGEYSWGSEAEKVYYGLGKKAAPKIDNRVREFLEKKKMKRV
ncbi:hypothetical protein HYU07_03575 [Candidatus Woesearchaeota archaeon]|nr:hypothetical protein [Candidatus Woesearchaeota archaeon]